MHRGRRGPRRRQQDGGLVNLKAFFVTTLSSALDLGIAVPDVEKIPVIGPLLDSLFAQLG